MLCMASTMHYVHAKNRKNKKFSMILNIDKNKKMLLSGNINWNYITSWCINDLGDPSVLLAATVDANAVDSQSMIIKWRNWVNANVDR